MNCQQTAHLLPWYLNTTLDATERRQVEDHLESCDECRVELSEAEAAMLLFGGHPTAAALVDYAFDAPGVPRDLVEAHLAGCPQCAEELAMVLESRAETDRPPAPTTEAEVPRDGARVVPLRRPAAPRPLWRAAAAAAVAAGLIGIAGGLWSWATLERERDTFAEARGAAEARIAELEAEIRGLAIARPNVPIHDLWPDGSVLRSAAAGPMRLPVEEGPAATVILNSDLGPGREVDRLEIRDGAGELLETLTGVRAGEAGSFTISLDLARLPRGRLQILLFAAGGVEPVEIYSVELG